MNTMSSKFGIGTHRTAIVQDNGSTVVTYHSTQVVSFNQRFINLHSGGHRTLTTKRRMNEASVTLGLGLLVYQMHFDWFVDYGGHKYLYHDRMTLDRDNKKAYTYDGTEIIPIASLVDGLGITRWVKN